MKNDNLSVSRRSFLAGSAAVGAFAAIGLAGCEASTAGKTNDAKASAVEDVAARDFGIAPVKVADAGTPAKECDYLVIGGGNCGMMSAAHAGELGLKTILLKKTSVTGGSSVGTEVTQAFSDCKIMQECVDDPEVINVSQQTGTPGDIFTYFMMHNSWESNAELVTNYIKTNHKYHDFLYEHGAYPMMLLPSLDAPTGGIMYKGQGIGTFEIMQKAAEEYGVEVLTSSPAIALVVDEDGAIVGAMAKINGDESYIKAKAVFVGTGGFSNNVEMIEEFIPGWGQWLGRTTRILLMMAMVYE